MDGRIRVLHVAQAAGGVDRYIRMLLKYLDRQKLENIVICSCDFKAEDYHGLVDNFEQIDMHRAIGISDVKAIYKTRALIKKYKPDIVYAHSSKAGVIARVADIGLRNVCIYNPHGWAFNMRCSRRKRMLYIVIERLAALFCQKIICISEAEKRSALDKKICGNKKLQVIFNGVDIVQYENQHSDYITRNGLGISDEAFIVGMAGRISPQKAPDIFIQVADRIKKDISNAYFIIVGSGEQEKLVTEYAEAHGLSNLLFITGWVDNPMNYIELFDVAMLLSRWEGFGLVLPEYMMAGKPIVATKVDAIPDIITDCQNGLLVEPEDVEGAYKAVVKLYEDIDLRKRLVAQSKKDVHEKYDARRVAKEHENLLISAMNEFGIGI